MQLYIYNSLLRKKELFQSIEPQKVKIYVCGMTVYDYCHIGHARVMVVFDIVVKWLRYNNYAVTYVRNITDIDDKIIERAVKNGESISSLTTRFIQAMHEDADKLGVARPDIEPKATDYIPNMLNMIGLLFKNELAYRSPNGDVNFSVRRFPDYGKLSGKNIDDLQSGHRDVADQHTNNSAAKYKQDDLDFVLWKASKQHEPSEVKWQSPWGEGRPGWHIECSAMSCSLLGQNFDIHGGGMDLQFPHHENEIAQTEGAFLNNAASSNAEHTHTSKHTKHTNQMANYWVHNGFVKVNDEKMSKSLGNFFTIRDVFKHYHAEVIRFFILKAHYRSPLNYADSYLEEAKSGLERIYYCLENTKNIEHIENINTIDNVKTNVCAYFQKFILAMNDDFNTSIAIAVIFELVNEINRNYEINKVSKLNNINNTHNISTLHQENLNLITSLRSMCKILGIAQLNAATELNVKNTLNTENDAVIAQIEQKIQQRAQAKLEKRYADADAIRQELLTLGIVLQDLPNGESTWKKA
jgi:cysteinyl-tRNA synthetase